MSRAGPPGRRAACAWVACCANGGLGGLTRDQRAPGWHAVARAARVVTSEVDAPGKVAAVPTPAFITELRALVGHRLLWLSTAIGVVIDGAGRVLLERRADTGIWALPGGIIDPAEQPADAAVREVFEETGVIAVPEALTSVTVSAPVTYGNGDQVQYLELVFRCRPAGGIAQVHDCECVEVGWYALDALPPLGESPLSHLAQALNGGNRTVYAFSGLPQVLGLPDDPSADG